MRAYVVKKGEKSVLLARRAILELGSGTALEKELAILWKSEPPQKKKKNKPTQ